LLVVLTVRELGLRHGDGCIRQTLGMRGSIQQKMHAAAVDANDDS